MYVIITYKDGRKEIKKKLSEIHFNHEPGRIAFESNSLQTGHDMDVNKIKEFEVFTN